jgi:hypothetical protein
VDSEGGPGNQEGQLKTMHEGNSKDSEIWVGYLDF